MNISIEKLAVTLGGIFIGLVLSGVVVVISINIYNNKNNKYNAIEKDHYVQMNTTLIENLNNYLFETSDMRLNTDVAYRTTGLQDLTKSGEIVIGGFTASKYYPYKNTSHDNMLNYITRKMYINSYYEDLVNIDKNELDNFTLDTQTTNKSKVDKFRLNIIGYENLNTSEVNNFIVNTELSYSIEAFVNIYLGIKDLIYVEILGLEDNYFGSNVPYNFILSLPTGDNYVFGYDLQLNEDNQKEIKYIIIERINYDNGE